MKRVGILGAGVIGERRMQMIQKTALGINARVFDTDFARRTLVAQRFGAVAAESAEAIIDDKSIDIVIVATPNAHLAGYAAAALKKGKHVLIEKPGAISLAEVETMRRAQAESGAVAKVGYNHRFHAAALVLDDQLHSGEHGHVLWFRGAYGHGGRPGYEKEWRFQRELSGGGETIDQGVHLLDLLRWYGGDFAPITGKRQNAFYRSSEDDNGFLILQSPAGAFAQLHCSATQWKNLFRWEVATEHSLFIWEGLGNPNYGSESLTVYRRNPAGGAPTEHRFEYGMCGMESWELEWKHFYGCVTQTSERDGRPEKVYSSLEDAQWVFQVLSRIDQDDVTSVKRSQDQV